MLNALSADASVGHPVIDAPEWPPLDPGRLHAEHDAFSLGLPCRGQAKHLRRRGAEQLLAAHPDLELWIARPIADRIAEARWLQAWPFLSWCFATDRLIPELDLLAGKQKGGHFSMSARCTRPTCGASTRPPPSSTGAVIDGRGSPITRSRWSA
jgi:hypothetical protein